MAITAGLDIAAGDAVVTMDGDLQDPPEVVEKMLEQYFKGFDVVYGTRSSREGETLFKRLTASGFYWLMRRFIHKDMVRDTGDFRLVSRRVMVALGCHREGHRFLRGLVASLGFHQTKVLFDRPARVHGETKFPLRKMLAFAFDGIFSFSSLPLLAGIYLGMTVIVATLGAAGFLIARKMLFHAAISDLSVFAVLGLGVAGMMLTCVGVVGIYVGKIYDEIKRRPLYIVRDTRNVAGAQGIQRSSWPTTPETPSGARDDRGAA
jgi:glycosyltransferase involved in cell wall biosynthesis